MSNPVNPWSSSPQARASLRTFLNDGPQDRPVKGKQVFGPVDGTNTQFITWEDRLVPGTLVVSINLTDVPASQVTEVDDVMGIFTLATPPQAQQIVRARYFFQYFLDTELDEALRQAAIECIDTDDITQVPMTLYNAALNYGGHFGFQKQAIRWAQRMSQRFLLEEEPTNEDLQARPNHFLLLAKEYWKQAVVMRDGVYMRKGRRNAPAFAINKPRLRPIAPRS